MFADAPFNIYEKCIYLALSPVEKRGQKERVELGQTTWLPFLVNALLTSQQVVMPFSTIFYA